MKRKIICALLALIMVISCVSVLSACGETEDPCTEHVDKKPKDGKCDVCGEKINKDDPGEDPGDDPGSTTCTRHTDKNNDGKCDNCDKDMGSGGGNDSYEITWDSVELTFMMMVTDSSNELTSTAERYIQGKLPKGETADNIDKAVAKRNKDADTAIKSTINYKYFPNTSDYGWGEASTQITTEIKAPNAKDLPDVYSHFIYDMVGSSLQGCFANLYATERKNAQGKMVEVNNYFPLLEYRDAFFDYEDEDDKFDEEKDGNGYMYEYMTTLTLSKNKMFLLASNYFTDLVRAFYVMPVNVKLIEELGEDKDLCPDDLVGNDGVYTIDDFYQEVYDGDWTYSRLREFAEAVFVDEGLASGEDDINDTLGFALQNGGLSASGILYSSQCIIVNREFDKVSRDFVYSYPQKNEEVFSLVSALNDLMDATGIMGVTGKTYENVQGATDAQTAVEIRFAQNKVLFGSIIQVGAFEREVFQEMNENDGSGFGLVPVPLYADNLSNKNYYTQIHNVGRIGAICLKTTKFDQCTAYLDYQSTHSEEILEGYYKYKLQYGALGGATGTVDMMNFIRNNVRTAFDKTWEDAIHLFYSAQDGGVDKRWHGLLMKGNYQVSDFRTQYNSLIGEKQKRLSNLVTYYETLAD